MRLTAHLYVALKAVGQLAQNLVLVGLLITAGQGASPGMSLSSVIVATFIPAVLLGPLCGVAVDRIGPVRAIALGWAVKALALLAAMLLLSGTGPIWLVAVLFACGHQLSGPGEMAFVRTLNADQRQKVHGGAVAAQYTGQGLALALAGPVVVFFGAGALVVAALACALLALLIVLGLKRVGPTIAAPRASETPGRGSWAAARILMVHRDGRLAVGALLLKSIAGRAVLVAVPLYFHRDLGMNPLMVAAIVIPAGAGIIVGLLQSSRLTTVARLRRELTIACVGMAVALVALAFLDYGITAAAQGTRVGPVVRMEAAVNTTLIVAVPMAAAMGYTLTTALTAGRGMLTRLGEVRQQGSIFAFQEAISEALALGPVVLIGLGVDFAGVRVTLAATGLVVAAVFVLLAFPRQALRMRHPDPTGAAT